MTNIQSGYLKTKNGVQLMTTVPYPIGAIYLSIDSTNPTKLFGGTWQQIAQGRTLVGVDTSQTEFNTVKKTGGEKTHTLIDAEIPGSIARTRLAQAGEWSLGEWGNHNPSHEAWTSCLPGQYGIDVVDKPHNNLQPYYTCYIWLRTA